jgi:pimeloyl-ACP methyl ester carboxylesterase
MRYVMLSAVPAVFVHGNPETASLWDELRSSLNRPDHIALSLPGFGCARPGGFGATKDEYAHWLADELDRLGEPVDLVGHDWGGFLVVRVASLRGDMLRSWASDALGAFDKGFEWHRWAKTWQRPGEGEAWVRRALATPLEVRAAAFEQLGVPRDRAATVAGWLDGTMGESMLALYRSAIDIAREWSTAADNIQRPGLAIIATADPWGNEELVRRVAETGGAQTLELDGLGHWWMLQNPRLGARALEDFWSSVRT